MELYNILIVDDEMSNLNALERTFRHEYSFFTATNGRDALTIMKQNEIALIIADHHMPIMTGIELLAEVTEKYPDTIRIILSENTDEELLMDAINKGHVYRFVAKPWDTKELRAIVREGIESYELTRTNRELYNRTLSKNKAISEEQMDSALQVQKSEQKTIGEILLERGMITKDQLEEAIKLQESDQRQLDEVLVDLGFVSPDNVEIARGFQRQKIKRLAEILIDLGYADEESIFSCYALQLGMPYISLSQFSNNPTLAEILPARLAYKYTVVPVDLVGRVLVVAALDPMSDEVKSEIEEEAGYKIMTVCTSHQEMETALKERYST